MCPRGGALELQKNRSPDQGPLRFQSPTSIWMVYLLKNAHLPRFQAEAVFKDTCLKQGEKQTLSQMDMGRRPRGTIWQRERVLVGSQAE